MSSRHSKLIERACRRLEAAPPEPDLATLAAEAGLSRWHFQRLFTAAIGISPKRYAVAQRQRRLEAALRVAPSVTDAIYDAGYPASSGAYRDLGGHGLKPGQLHSGGAGELIHYSTATSSLGPLLVAASDRGVCMIDFGAPTATMARLQQRFPNAQLNAASKQLRDWIRVVVAQIDAPQSGADLPLDIRGTVFQTRVWRALTRIPVGQTLSYAALARRIGAASSARAVARACATNGIAVLVPCHRVISSNGELNGYKWGVELKRQLLEREATSAKAKRRS